MISSADFQKITTLIFDIDGTLTDGRAGYMPDGQVVKFFDHHDMHWIKLALRSGLRIVLLSGGDDFAGRHLVEILNIPIAVFGAKDKLAVFNELLTDNNLLKFLEKLLKNPFKSGVITASSLLTPFPSRCVSNNLNLFFLGFSSSSYCE